MSDRDINFVAARTILTGEELTVDYRTFSDHAAPFAALWGKAEGPGVPDA